MEAANGTQLPAYPIPNLDAPAELVGNAQYEVIRELGRGGMGVVYLARNKLMDRLEVLKVVNKRLLPGDGEFDIAGFLQALRSNPGYLTGGNDGGLISDSDLMGLEADGCRA